MQPSTAAGNPFALMIEPEAVFAAIERSERLARLKSTICHPLDKPRPEPTPVEVKVFDDEVDGITVEDPPFFGG